jgi:hypothetical protein
LDAERFDLDDDVKKSAQEAGAIEVAKHLEDMAPRGARTARLAQLA